MNLGYLCIEYLVFVIYSTAHPCTDSSTIACSDLEIAPSLHRYVAIHLLASMYGVQSTVCIRMTVRAYVRKYVRGRRTFSIHPSHPSDYRVAMHISDI